MIKIAISAILLFNYDITKNIIFLIKNKKMEYENMSITKRKGKICMVI
jgi:hypothetical protein